ncbi:MAG TPA: hypothetical protein VHF88_06970, partial [Thermoleophilaceae bacterium]|nr:hypothetical protein [Thermoleophilaceae bacterium]
AAVMPSAARSRESTTRRSAGRRITSTPTLRPAGVLWASLAIWSLLACALILANLRALPALLSLSLFRPYVDADEVARWVAKRLGISQPVRATPGDPERRSRTELLAKVTYFAQPFKRFMSELAEATAPPFFKSFLRVDVDGDRKLTITCFGVTGLPEHEDDPSIEHVVGPIALREAQPPPGRAQPAGQPRYSSSYSDSRASSAPRLA